MMTYGKGIKMMTCRLSRVMSCYMLNCSKNDHATVVHGVYTNMWSGVGGFISITSSPDPVQSYMPACKLGSTSGYTPLDSDPCSVLPSLCSWMVQSHRHGRNRWTRGETADRGGPVWTARNGQNSPVRACQRRCSACLEHLLGERHGQGEFASLAPSVLGKVKEMLHHWRESSFYRGLCGL